MQTKNYRTALMASWRASSSLDLAFTVTVIIPALVRSLHFCIAFARKSTILTAEMKCCSFLRRILMKISLCLFQKIFKTYHLRNLSFRPSTLQRTHRRWTRQHALLCRRNPKNTENEKCKNLGKWYFELEYIFKITSGMTSFSYFLNFSKAATEETKIAGWQ